MTHEPTYLNHYRSPCYPCHSRVVVYPCPYLSVSAAYAERVACEQESKEGGEMTRIKAIQALRDLRHVSGTCAKCSKPALVVLCEQIPIGSQEDYEIGTSCCESTLRENDGR